MSKYKREDKKLKKIIKYCKEKETEANKEKLTDVGEAYHDVVHYIVELLNEE